MRALTSCRSHQPQAKPTRSVIHWALNLLRELDITLIWMRGF